MGEVFQVVFNSQGANVVDATNGSLLKYNVNWTAFLPLKYKRFSCKFTFKSAAYSNSILSTNGLVYMNIGRMNTFDGLQQNQVLGVVSPVILSTTQTVAAAAIPAAGGNPAVAAVYAVALLSRYEANNNDNNEFWIDYPTNPIVTLSFKTLTNGYLPFFQSYVLVLTLTGIENDN